VQQRVIERRVLIDGRHPAHHLYQRPSRQPDAERLVDPQTLTPDPMHTQEKTESHRQEETQVADSKSRIGGLEPELRPQLVNLRW
jgi:hypothetical protein